MNGSELDNLFPDYEFVSDEDAVKMVVFYFIELTMMGREKRQHMDWTMLASINEWKDFFNYDWGIVIF